MLTRYINPASNGGDGTSNALTGANAAFVSLNAAEAAFPATITDAYDLFCETDGTADTSAVTFSGITTTSTNKITVKAVGAYRHAGKWDASKYRLSIANVQPISVQINDVWFDGLQAEKTSSNTTGVACFGAGSVSGSNAIWMSNCIARQAGHATLGEPGFQCNNAARVMYLWNCVAYGSGAAAVGGNSSLSIISGNVTAYSCTFIGGYRGMTVGSGATGTFKNCYAYGPNLGYNNGGTMNLTTCASNDTTGSAGLHNIPRSTATFVNVTAGSDDYHLVAGSALLNVGTNTSGDAAPMNFTDDIDGVVRSGSWDIGADEFVAVGVPLPMALYHLRQQGIS